MRRKFESHVEFVTDPKARLLFIGDMVTQLQDIGLQPKVSVRIEYSIEWPTTKPKRTSKTS